MSPIAKEILETSGQIEAVIDNDPNNGNPEVLATLIDQYDALAVRSGTRVTEEVLEKAERLKVIGRAGVGVDNIDVAAATQKGVVVMNAPGGNTVTTAEHAISMLMALARNIPKATASMRKGLWEKKKLSGVEISDKVLGIIGLGQIGRIVASRAQGLKMKVIAVDPFVSEEAAEALQVELVDLEALYHRADFITLHVPSLKETRGMLNRETFACMKTGVRIVNCSRGDIIVIDDLIEALDRGQIAGAALDVFPAEPPDPDWPLLQHPKVIFTPHLGASTGEAQEKVARMIAEQISAYLLDNVITNALNFPSVSAEVSERIAPYFQLAERLGRLMGQLIGKVHDITLTYSGEAAAHDTRPLTRAALKGILSASSDMPVNYVSAPSLARAKGMAVKETITETDTDFTGLMTIRFEDVAQGPQEVWGTVFDKQFPRLVKLGAIRLDAIPEGSMIVIENIDRPGVIGHIGTTLGNHGINIARFQLGRRRDRALCLVNIDTPADDDVLAAIKAFEPILSARQVHLS
jgi:D-3-phosphoglycerate dehydrogenase